MINMYARNCEPGLVMLVGEKNVIMCMSLPTVYD